jgi:urea-proton symporter
MVPYRRRFLVPVLFITALATAFHLGGVNMTWLLYMLGVFFCPGVFLTSFALLWKRQTKAAAMISPIVGMLCGLAVWLGTAYHYYGEIIVASTGGTMPCLFATITSFIVPLPITVAISLSQGQEFDWSIFRQIQQVKSEQTEAVNNRTEQKDQEPSKLAHNLKRMARWAALWAAFTIIGQVLLWPLPMYGAKMSFSKSVSNQSCYMDVVF